MEDLNFEELKAKTLEQLKTGQPLLRKDREFAPLLEAIINSALEGETDVHLT